MSVFFVTLLATSEAAVRLQPRCLSATSACWVAVALGTTRDLDAHPQNQASVTLLTYTTTTTAHALRELADAASVTNRQRLRSPTLKTNGQPICFVANLHPLTNSIMAAQVNPRSKARPTQHGGRHTQQPIGLLCLSCTCLVSRVRTSCICCSTRATPPLAPSCCCCSAAATAAATCCCSTAACAGCRAAAGPRAASVCR